MRKLEVTGKNSKSAYVFNLTSNGKVSERKKTRKFAEQYTTYLDMGTCQTDKNHQ